MERETRKCIVCGKEFTPSKVYARCCSGKCSQKNWRIEHGQCRKNFEGKKQKCIICGKEFTPYRSEHICCSPECSKKRNYQVTSTRKKQQYRDMVEKKKAMEAMPKSNHDAIANIAIEARKHGMSYGEYVGKYLRGNEK